eukprot:TRINITY_DN31112_c0_g1_i2.p1 TRINITY_DN31112_c0_g1~~TRINITY_DN31112_c0_g1_i2.p1  ORF type:complete len:119 (-),score=33.43 TRINITY_DN31112_c0_g1_i2:91-447(-)
MCIRDRLKTLDLSTAKWIQFFQDLPSLTSKIKVADKSKVKTQWDEQRVISPASIQEEIDAITAKVDGSRAFIRPSGTEDVVRLYVEAPTIDNVKDITTQISQAVLGNKELNQPNEQSK